MERKKKSDGSKLSHFTLNNDKGSQTRWAAQKYPQPRPIYNLRDLYLDRFKQKLVIVEGEKACEAYSKKRLQNALLELRCHAVLENDWKIATQYNEIILCPDNDKMVSLRCAISSALGEDLDCDINK